MWCTRWARRGRSKNRFFSCKEGLLYIEQFSFNHFMPSVQLYFTLAHLDWNYTAFSWFQLNLTGLGLTLTESNWILLLGNCPGDWYCLACQLHVTVLSCMRLACHYFDLHVACMHLHVLACACTQLACSCMALRGAQTLLTVTCMHLHLLIWAARFTPSHLHVLACICMCMHVLTCAPWSIRELSLTVKMRSLAAKALRYHLLFTPLAK